MSQPGERDDLVNPPRYDPEEVQTILSTVSLSANEKEALRKRLAANMGLAPQ